MSRYYPARGWLIQHIIVYRHSAGGRTGPRIVDGLGPPQQLVGYLGCELRTAATPKPTRYRALDYNPRYRALLCGLP